MENINPALTVHFANLVDPRIVGKTSHLLIDIIVISVCGVIAGASGWEQIEVFGKARQDWFAGFLELPGGIPSHDTFRRVLSRIDAKKFQKCFLSWVKSITKVIPGEVIPIDGKTLRRSYDSGSNKKPIHMVSAWASENRLVLGQVKTAEKSNEITAIPELIDLLDIKGCIVTIDAMGCQRKIAGKIVKKGGDYILGLKGNQETLHEKVAEIFEEADEETLNSSQFDCFQTTEKGHGREETRTHYTTSASSLPMISKWPGLKTVGIVVSERSTPKKTSLECRYYISSLPSDAEQFAKAVRSHWGIENSLHYVLDVSFREDECRIRKGNAPQNFAVLRHIARNLLQQEKTKMSIKKKQFRSACDAKFLGQVVFG